MASYTDLTAKGIQAPAPGAPMEVVDFQRHAPGPLDIVIRVTHCGVCHTDCHACFDPPGPFGEYPVMPGHEACGVVEFVGSQVQKFKVGDHACIRACTATLAVSLTHLQAVASKHNVYALYRAYSGVGCMVDSCQKCEYCTESEEQYCVTGSTFTYGADPVYGRAGPSKTQGGYSSKMVVHEHFAVLIPKSMPLEVAGPIMCAGITMYDPLQHWKAGSDKCKRVGIVGGGGLGHMGITLAKAMGCTVTCISTSPSKAEALKKLGADTVVISTDADAMKAAARTLDLILNTVSAPHDMMAYHALLRPNGTRCSACKVLLQRRLCTSAVDGSTVATALCTLDHTTTTLTLTLHTTTTVATACYNVHTVVQLGLVNEPHPVNQVAMLWTRTGLSGSLIGGMRATQEVVDLCAEKKIYPKVEVVPCSRIDSVFQELNSKSATVQRFVLDIANTLDDFVAAKTQQ
eukprot:3129-Heterococcus_DN1.PRE.1